MATLTTISARLLKAKAYFIQLNVALLTKNDREDLTLEDIEDMKPLKRYIQALEWDVASGINNSTTQSIYRKLLASISNYSGDSLLPDPTVKNLTVYLPVSSGDGTSIVTFGQVLGDPLGNSVLAGLFDEKVDKVEGKGLSTNDLTDEVLSKIDNPIIGSGNLTSDLLDKINNPEIAEEDLSTELADKLNNHTHIVSSITGLEDDLNAKVDVSSIGQPLGVAPLNSSGKIDNSLLSSAPREYKGTWNATTNTPTLSDSTGTSGWQYTVSVAGTQNLGSGDIIFTVGDTVSHNGTIWENIEGLGSGVQEINGKTGSVISLDKTDLDLDFVDNTADVDKPISIATQAALDLKADSTYVDNEIASVQSLIPTDYLTEADLPELPENIATTEEVDTAVSTAVTELKGGATETYDTLEKIHAIILSWVSTILGDVGTGYDSLEKIVDWATLTFASLTQLNNSISDLKGGVSTSADTLKKLHDILLSSLVKESFEDIAARDAYDIPKGAYAFVEDYDGLGNWALYYANTEGVGAQYTLIQNEEMLNTTMSGDQIKSSLLSVPDTKLLTDSLYTRLVNFSYNDLSNKPTIPAAQAQSDWNTVSTGDVTFIKNKPFIPTALSQLSNDLNFVSATTPITATPTVEAVSIEAGDTLSVMLWKMQKQLDRLNALASADEGYPPTLSSLTSVVAQDIPFPDYLVPVIDMSYGSPRKITRISDPSTFGTAALGHGYSKRQYWNADGSFLKLNQRTLLDGNTYEYMRNMSTPSGETVWSNIRPNILYVVGASKIVEFDVNTSVRTTIIDFAALGYSGAQLGNNEGNISADDRYMVVISSLAGVQTYLLCDVLAGTVVSARNKAQLGFTGTLDWIGVSKGGGYIIVSDPNKTVFDINWNKISGPIGGASIHTDTGWDVLGNEVRMGAGLYNYRLLADPSPPYKPIISNADLFAAYNEVNGLGGHCSTENMDLPGWGYISLTGGSTSTAENLDIISVRLADPDTNPLQVRRWCHHRRVGFDYDTEPQASPSRDGRKVLFTSNWNNISDGVGYSFVVEIPD